MALPCESESSLVAACVADLANRLACGDVRPWVTVVVRSPPLARGPDVAQLSCRSGSASPRARPVADAFGAPVLRDQGPIGRPGTARPIPVRADRPS
jgi:hypothetical protein